MSTGGGTGGRTRGASEEVASRGGGAAVVVLLLVAAVLVVLAPGRAVAADVRVRPDNPALRLGVGSDLPTRETLASFTWSREDHEWWMYGPVSLVIACARVGRGWLGRSVASCSPAALDSALALSELVERRRLRRRRRPRARRRARHGRPGASSSRSHRCRIGLRGLAGARGGLFSKSATDCSW